MPVALSLLSFVATAVGAVPLPTPSQLNYQRQEIIGLTHFNMATFYKDGDPACDSGNWGTSQLPSSFKPSNLNISNWIEKGYKAVGVKSAILTAKHGCGFLLWPTNVTLPNGENYGYHVGGKGGIGVDIVGMFTKEMTAAGLPHSFYYSLKDSFYLNAINDNVKPPGTALPGQVAVTQDQFEDISVAAVQELWSRYGNLSEIWFDGGISSRISTRIVSLLEKYQPNAITMGAGIGNDKNEVDWIGTESGEPRYPVWSTGCNKPGAGSTGESPKTATDFCPKCGDCTLQAPDHWFWMPNTPIKPLSQLQTMYHDTVGSNAVMELDFAIDRTGNIDPTHATRYAEFGNWIRSCYGTPTASTPFTMTNSLTLDVPVAPLVDRIQIQEDISRGQRVTAWTVECMVKGGLTWQPFASGSAIGHKRIAIADSSFSGEVVKLRLNVTDGVELPASVSLASFAKAPCM